MTELNSYQNGKIYKIWSLEIDEIYIGSTIQPLHKRMYKHKNDAKKHIQYKLYKEMTRLGEDAFRIELIENYPCSHRDELHKREGHWIRELKATLNMRIAGRSTQEYYQDNRESKLTKQTTYRLQHLEAIAETNKLYRLKNTIKISEQRKAFREANKDQLQEKSKNYREQNKEKIKAHNSEVHVCPICGSSYTHNHKARHERTRKHLHALEQQS